jgi:hypothetical protein
METTSGLTVEQLHDGQIVIFTVHDMSPATVEAWANKVIEMTEARQAKHICYIHDASYVAFSMTPHFRRHSERIAAAHPDAEGHVAIILRESILLKLTRIFIENLVKRAQPKIATRIFFERGQALEWLTEYIKSTSSRIK